MLCLNPHPNSLFRHSSASPAAMFFTAGALLSFFLLLCLALIHNSQSTDISVGSNLSAAAAAKASWLSPSGRFSFGFYSKGKEFLVGIQLIINPKQPMVVWTARLDLKPFSKAATLRFTADGFLLTPNSGRGDPPFFLLNFSSSASSASMLDNGNFVVYSSNSSTVSTSANFIWKSFDYPTDTILGSQSLPSDHNLTSAVSSSSSKAYVLKMQLDSNLVIYPAVNSSVAIWFSQTDGYGYKRLVLDEGGRLYLSDDFGITKDLSGYNPPKAQANVIYAAKLVDNVFRLFEVTNTSITEVNDIPYFSNKCSNPEICGVNSICVVGADAPNCICPLGFAFIQANSDKSGCQRNETLPKCNAAGGSPNVTMSKLDHVISPDLLAYPVVSATTGDECSNMCLHDCDCHAAVFRDQQCSMLKLPLSGVRIDPDDPGVFFVKIMDPGSGNHTKPHRKVRVGAVTAYAFVSGILCLAVTASCGRAYWLLIGRFREEWENWDLAFSEEIAPRYFDYKELLCGPGKSRSELGRGAHGTVFKVELGSHLSVAVKVLHGADIAAAEKDFRTEMSLMGRAHHANLVPLLGFCHDGLFRFLVYEYMPRKSLANYILECHTDDHGWARRAKLLLGAARGIHYLHRDCETKIIHRDIKPENILISLDWTAKISDFGLAKFVTGRQTSAATWTGAAGTDGYIAPECRQADEASGTVMFTEKADVYSYGVVVMETVCGRRNRDGSDLPGLARKCYDAGEIWMLVGGELVVPTELERVVKMGKQQVVKESEIERVVKIGILCVQEDPLARPSMEDVVMMLDGDLDVPNPPPLPSPEKTRSLLRR